MIRLIVTFSMLLVSAGCQRSYCGGPSGDLDRRLAAIERDRLPLVSGERVSADAACVSPGQPPRVRANEPVRLSLLRESFLARAARQNTGRSAICGTGVSPVLIHRPEACARSTWQKAVDDWTLSDFGEDPVGDDPATDVGFSEYDSVREEQYLRRPPLASFWETVRRDVRHLPGDLWRDTKRVYANPVNLVILGTAYGGALVLQEAGPDDRVEDHFRGGHDHFDKEWREAFGAIGNPGTHFGLAGLWYLIGQQTQDDKTYEVGKTMFSALIINGLTTMLGQAASWDRGPNGELGTFPSGHTSSSFAMASVLHEAYGHAVGVPLYGLATLVAIERIDDDEHYLSDVVMGAVVGTVIGHSVASGRDPELFGWKVLPYANPNGGTGVAFVKTLR